MWYLAIYAATFQIQFAVQNKSNFAYLNPFWTFLEGLEHNRTEKLIIRIEKVGPKKPDFNAS